MVPGSLVQAVSWAVLWALLFWVSRVNHPTAMLNASATTLMVLASAGAFAVISQPSKRVTATSKVCTAALSIIGAAILAALAICAIYDMEIGPDPRRFGLASNIGMDTAVVLVLVTLMGALDWTLRRSGFKSKI